VAVVELKDGRRRAPVPSLSGARGEDDEGVGERRTDLWPERSPWEVDLGDVAGKYLPQSTSSPRRAGPHNARWCSGSASTSDMWWQRPPSSRSSASLSEEVPVRPSPAPTTRKVTATSYGGRPAFIPSLGPRRRSRSGCCLGLGPFQDLVVPFRQTPA
jgi:hypothetical protein